MCAKRHRPIATLAIKAWPTRHGNVVISAMSRFAHLAIFAGSTLPKPLVTNTPRGYMDSKTGRRQKRISAKQEVKIAADLGGRTQANSGATRLGGGGDVRAPNVRVECKYTEQPLFIIKLRELDKLKAQAIKLLEEPVLQFSFRSRSGVLDPYAVIKWDAIGDWRALTILVEGLSLRVHQEDLRLKLHLNRMKISFGTRSFEVLHWGEYLKRRGENECSN